jgi:hypothetical protein
MRRRQAEPPPGLLVFNGRVYATEVERQQAMDARAARRQRWLDHIEQERAAECLDADDE